MQIAAPTTTKLGTNGNIIIRGVDFKTVQDILVNLPARAVRFLVQKIIVLSKTVASVSNGATVVVKEVDRATHTAATLSTAMTGTNNDLTFTAVPSGVLGNDVTITLVDPSENDAELEITVAGTDISVSLATDGGGAITTTAAQLKAALDADEDAAALITTANKSANDGTGVVTALAETALAGGLDWTVIDTLVASTNLGDTEKTGFIQDLTLAATREAAEGGHALLFQITTGATATTDEKDVIIDYLVA